MSTVRVARPTIALPPGMRQFRAPGPWKGMKLTSGERLHYLETIGADRVVVWRGPGPRVCVGLIRRGHIHEASRIELPLGPSQDPTAHDEAEIALAIQLAEVYVAKRRERHVPKRKNQMGEAWLRRQLKGLTA
jgi:hypothetical protein